MRARGFSLVEMVVVIAVVSILLAIGTLKFNSYLKRYRAEAQTRAIHAELLQARVNAVYQRRSTRVRIYPSRLEVYSSAADHSSGVAPARTRRLDLPVVCNGVGSAQHGYSLLFDEKGICSVPRSICLAADGDAFAVDSVVIYKTRLRIGKREMGEECDDENIDPR